MPTEGVLVLDAVQVSLESSVAAPLRTNKGHSSGGLLYTRALESRKGHKWGGNSLPASIATWIGIQGSVPSTSQVGDQAIKNRRQQKEDILSYPVIYNYPSWTTKDHRGEE